MKPIAADSPDPISVWVRSLPNRPYIFEDASWGDPFGRKAKKDSLRWRQAILTAAGLSDTAARLLLSRDNASPNLLWQVYDAADRETASALADACLFEHDRSYPHVYHITTDGRFTAAVLRQLGRG